MGMMCGVLTTMLWCLQRMNESLAVDIDDLHITKLQYTRMHACTHPNSRNAERSNSRNTEPSNTPKLRMGVVMKKGIYNVLSHSVSVPWSGRKKSMTVL